ncbi:hypothetical protein HMPREF3091_10405 [Hafnia sp. HMSC23F03]|nr:hypothetical protein HMPREF3091_10405 [Hafnia sp. HMSC23F03]
MMANRIKAVSPMRLWDKNAKHWTNVIISQKWDDAHIPNYDGKYVSIIDKFAPDRIFPHIVQISSKCQFSPLSALRQIAYCGNLFPVMPPPRQTKSMHWRTL